MLMSVHYSQRFWCHKNLIAISVARTCHIYLLKSKFAAKFEHHCFNLSLLYNKHSLNINHYCWYHHRYFCIYNYEKFPVRFAGSWFSFCSFNLEIIWKERLDKELDWKGLRGLIGEKEVDNHISLKFF